MIIEDWTRIVWEFKYFYHNCILLYKEGKLNLGKVQSSAKEFIKRLLLG